MDEPFFEILLKYTSIDRNFIKTFFKKFKIGEELEFHIKDKDLAKYLNIELITLRNRLNNNYSKNKNYMENVDFIKKKSTTYRTSKTYMLNYQCMEKIAMNTDTKEGEEIRTYFTQLRRFLIEYQKIIHQSLTNYEDLKKYSGMETIYFFCVDERYPDIFLSKTLSQRSPYFLEIGTDKVGRTSDILRRLRVYNVGRINEIDLKYLVLVKNSVLIENCIKENLFENKLNEKKEVYKINPKKLKKIINNCICNNMDKQNYNDLYEELGELLKLYNYVKNKNNIKPFIIINKK